MKGALVLVLCVVTQLHSAPKTFFAELGDELRKLFENAWTAVKDFIKRPIRVKRILGNGQKATLPRTTASPDDVESEITRTEKYISYYLRSAFTEKSSDCKHHKYCKHDTNKITSNKQTTRATRSIHDIRKDGKVILPVIEEPVWKTMRDWYEVQNLRWGQSKGDGVFKADEKEDDLNVIDATESYGDEIDDELPNDLPIAENIRLMIFI